MPMVSGAPPGEDQAVAANSPVRSESSESQMESMLRAASTSRGTSTRQWGQYFSRPVGSWGRPGGSA
jgi:hypothetical protein